MSRTLSWLIAAFFIVALSVAPAAAGMWGPQQAGRVAVTVYEHANFTGRQATFFGDTAWLPRGISSIRVQGRCTVTLYGNYNFQGRRLNVTSDVPNLAGSSVGNDRVLSLTISPFRTEAPSSPPVTPPSGSKGGLVILYEHEDFGGRSVKATKDIRSFKRFSMGNDIISSIRIRNARVTVYEHADFKGRSQTFTNSVRRLTGTRIGNDTISSVRIRWSKGSGGGGFNRILEKPIKANP